MNRKEYTDAVLTALRHVTDRERLAIRAELDAHIEDHIAALRELDYPPELAEERALGRHGRSDGGGQGAQCVLSKLVLGDPGPGGGCSDGGAVHSGAASRGASGNGGGEYQCPDLPG